MILSEGWRVSAVTILDDPVLTTEQGNEDGERYKKNMKVVECRRAKRKYVRLVFIKNSLSSNLKIALKINIRSCIRPVSL